MNGHVVCYQPITGSDSLRRHSVCIFCRNKGHVFTLLKKSNLGQCQVKFKAPYFVYGHLSFSQYQYKSFPPDVSVAEGSNPKSRQCKSISKHKLKNYWGHKWYGLRCRVFLDLRYYICSSSRKTQLRKKVSQIDKTTPCTCSKRKGFLFRIVVSHSHLIHCSCVSCFIWLIIFLFYLFAFTLLGAYNFYLYMRDTLLLNSAPYRRSISHFSCWAIWIKCLAQGHPTIPGPQLYQMSDWMSVAALRCSHVVLVVLYSFDGKLPLLYATYVCCLRAALCYTCSLKKYPSWFYKQPVNSWSVYELASEPDGLYFCQRTRQVKQYNKFVYEERVHLKWSLFRHGLLLWEEKL